MPANYLDYFPYYQYLMPWSDFHRLWLKLLPNKNSDVLDLVEDAPRISATLSAEELTRFAESLYVYDLIQQASFGSDVDTVDCSKTRKILITKKENDSGPLFKVSPAAMPLALLSEKTCNFANLTVQEYKIWRAIRQKLNNIIEGYNDFSDLCKEAPEYFPRTLFLQDVWLTTLNRHKEIDFLISHLLFNLYESDCSACGRLFCRCRKRPRLQIQPRECKHPRQQKGILPAALFSQEEDVDTVSVTANPATSSMLYAICETLKLDWEFLKEVAECVNSSHRIITIKESFPRLIIVPNTKHHNSARLRQLVTSLIHEANELNTEGLQMTHYAFCNGLGKPEELSFVLSELLYPHLKTTIKNVIFDYDFRVRKEFYEYYNRA
jgi:hypothetical protein